MTLTPKRWQKARDVLHEAMQMDEAERPAFLDSQCASDPSLRIELNELLAAEGELGSSFLEKPAIAHSLAPTPPQCFRPEQGSVPTSCNHCSVLAAWERFIAPTMHR